MLLENLEVLFGYQSTTTKLGFSHTLCLRAAFSSTLQEKQGRKVLYSACRPNLQFLSLQAKIV
jgi:hypothetical protein